MTKEEVNCVNLVPPLVRVPRWHCDMGGGREGDCFIFLNEATRCSFREEKVMRVDKKRKKPLVIKYPDLEVINLGDPELQKDLILKGVAVGMPGGHIVFTRDIELVAGGKEVSWKYTI